MNKFHQALRTVGLTAAAGLLALSGQANAETIVSETFNGGDGIFSSYGSTAFGSYGVRLRGSSSTDGQMSAWFDARGVSAMTLSFTNSLTGLDAGEYGEITVRDIDTNTVLYTRRAQTGSLLPAGNKIALSGSHANIEIRFAVNANSSLEYLTVDNVLVEGTRTAGCDYPQRGGSYTCTLGSRAYEMYVPATIPNTSGFAPIVLDLHDYQKTAANQKSSSGWKQFADTSGMIVVWPQGVSNAWNAQGACCGPKAVNDVKFLSDLSTRLRTYAGSRHTPVLVTGLGNGGSMAHTMACEASTIVDAAVPVGYSLAGESYSSIVQNCTPTRPIPIVQLHGTKDAFSSYNDGAYDSLGALESLDAWAQINGCMGSSTNATTTAITSSTSCAEAYCTYGDLTPFTTGLCTVTNGDHDLYNDVGGSGLAAEAWKRIGGLGSHPQ